VIKLSTAAPLRGEKRWNFIPRQPDVYIASTVGDDPIYVSPVWYVVRPGEKRIYTFIDQASHAEKNFGGDGKVSACVAGGTHFGDAHGVMFKEITMEVVDDPDLRDELQELALEKYFYGGHPYRQEFIDFGHYHDRRWYRLVPKSTTSWDLRELAPLAAREKRYFPPGMEDRIVSTR
jgi:hypothetical protein